MTRPPLTDLAACVFGAYGTVLDSDAVLRRTAGALGGRAEALGASWQTRRLEQTWQRSLMERYADFWQITGEALDGAMAETGFADPGLRARLMELMLQPGGFPDAVEALKAVRRHGLRTAVLSNATPSMLASALDGAQLRPLIDVMLSVDPLRIYKPHPSVYRLACDRLELSPRRILYVSAQDWDVAGAAAFGLRVAWVNRHGRRQGQRLSVAPDAEIASLADLAGLIGS